MKKKVIEEDKKRGQMRSIFDYSFHFKRITENIIHLVRVDSLDEDFIHYYAKATSNPIV
jgi:hypothetical protein